MSASSADRIQFFDYHPQMSDFHAEALAGLQSHPKRVSPKFFYDQRGSQLFDRITQLREYYPARTETAILESHVCEIVDLFGPNCLLIEYGSGSSQKIRVLLDGLAGNLAGYLAIDISKEHLIEATAGLADAYPELDVFAVCADYTRPLDLPAAALEKSRRRVVFFPGSTIGNFTEAESRDFLRATAETAGPHGGLLIGADLRKERRILEAAYNDAEGVTADFNLNLLRRMNSELGANFDLASFRHRAFYDEQQGRVEMHLESAREQRVRLNGATIEFAAGETIHTESSHKFTINEFQRLAAESGFQPEKVWTDPEELFSVHYMSVA